MRQCFLKTQRYPVRKLQPVAAFVTLLIFQSVLKNILVLTHQNTEIFKITACLFFISERLLLIF